MGLVRFRRIPFVSDKKRLKFALWNCADLMESGIIWGQEVKGFTVKVLLFVQDMGWMCFFHFNFCPWFQFTRTPKSLYKWLHPTFPMAVSNRVGTRMNAQKTLKKYVKNHFATRFHTKRMSPCICNTVQRQASVTSRHATRGSQRRIPVLVPLTQTQV